MNLLKPIPTLFANRAKPSTRIIENSNGFVKCLKSWKTIMREKIPLPPKSSTVKNMMREGRSTTASSLYSGIGSNSLEEFWRSETRDQKQTWNSLDLYWRHLYRTTSQELWLLHWGAINLDVRRLWVNQFKTGKEVSLPIASFSIKPCWKSGHGRRTGIFVRTSPSAITILTVAEKIWKLSSQS